MWDFEIKPMPFRYDRAEWEKRLEEYGLEGWEPVALLKRRSNSKADRILPKLGEGIGDAAERAYRQYCNNGGVAVTVTGLNGLDITIAPTRP